LAPFGDSSSLVHVFSCISCFIFYFPRDPQVLEGLRAVIDDDQIPQEYGGSCSVPLGCMPQEQALREHAFQRLKEHNVALVSFMTMRK
jgi:hypothetical protein